MQSSAFSVALGIWDGHKSRILGIMVRNGSRMEGNFLGDVSKKINNTGEMPLKIHTLKFFSTPLRPESSSPKGCNHYKMVCPAVTTTK